MNIIGYGICTGGAEKLEDATENLKNSVLQRMREGWEPQGGVAHVVLEFPNAQQHILTQAVIKHEAQP
jgi:hypothetical protein